ncbi:nucleotidyltransferase domain-containing protein [Candidatus Woesearchaeota archaeon]|nr:nucleotidyltransferase domain-containing protein [Candidatus Woesearchaeota archaeon]
MTKKKTADFSVPKELIDKTPADMKTLLNNNKASLLKFQKELLIKFDKYVMGLTVLKPSNDEKLKGKTQILVLVDDSDSKQMSKIELKDKLTLITKEIAQKTNKNFVAETLLLSELWQNFYDAKHDKAKQLAESAIFYDSGMLQAIKITEIHKEMVLKKFEKYIVSYVLAGSLVQGKATPTSDIDVWIVIDDTDVKKMGRAELKDKLRAIIIGYGLDAGDATGIKNKLNIQPYILTDFWDYLKEANPIIFTLLRDGVPLYDRGIFMPWKQLLKMGRIKPSQEAIDMFMNTGEQMLKRTEFKLKEIGLEDFFWATSTPTQAAIMLYGVAPPAPSEIPQMMRELFVKKEKIFEEKHVKILEKILKTRKSLEHGTKKGITGSEVDGLLKDTKEYLKSIEKLFEKINKKKEAEQVNHIYDSAITTVRDCLLFEGVTQVKDSEILNTFKQVLVNKGHAPQKYHRLLQTIITAENHYKQNKLTKAEVEKTKKISSDFMRFMIDLLQRLRGKELNKTKIRFKHGKKYGELTLLGDTAFIIPDLDATNREIMMAKVDKTGKLSTTKKSDYEALEKAIATVKLPQKTFIKQPVFADLAKLFGKDIEILVYY